MASGFEIVWFDAQRQQWQVHGVPYATAREARDAAERLVDLMKREGLTARADTVWIRNAATGQFVE